MNPTVAIAAAHAFATVAMAGLIWFVQIVHYPLLAAVGDEQFRAYQAANLRRTTWVVGPLMLTEVASASWLALWPPTPAARPAAWLGLGLLALVWVSTAGLQVPCHSRLERGFESGTARRLVATNWLRTAAWSVRGVLALLILMA